MSKISILGRAGYMKAKASSFAFILAMSFFVLSLLVNTQPRNSEKVAEQASQRLEKRMEQLEKFMSQALESDHRQWMDLGNLPHDMVIYRYVYDTLQSWNNQFPVINDDISSRLIFSRLSNLRGNLSSPLAEVRESPAYVNLGSKWYIVYYDTDYVSCRVIGGLEVKDIIYSDVSSTGNGANPALRVPANFSITPLNYTGGSTVYLDGAPMFKILAEARPDMLPINASVLRWLALFFFTVSVVLYLWTHREIKYYFISLGILLCMEVAAYLWGFRLQNSVSIFSPNVYADGRLFYSFGSLLIVNTYFFLFIMCTYIMRNVFVRDILRRSGRLVKNAYFLYVILMFFATAAYIHVSLRSLIMNSNISLEFYALSSISVNTLWVYLSYTTLFLALLMLIQMLKPVVYSLTGLRYNVFSRKFLFVYAGMCALYLSIAAGSLGFRKEMDRMMVWTNRLAIDRDLGLELQLRSVERGIANDPLFSTLAVDPANDIIILNRLTENYLNRISSDYDISVSTCRDSDLKSTGSRRPSVSAIETMDYFNQKLRSGTPISDNSRFLYTYDNAGRSSYTGWFIYYSHECGIIRMFIEIGSRASKEENGYYSILGEHSQLGEVVIPPLYSYSKFISGKLVNYKGTYAYPTVMGSELQDEIRSEEGHVHFKSGGYLHFANQVSQDEIIIISRPVRGVMTYLVTFSYLILTAYAGLLLVTRNRRKREKVFRKNYYRSRINTILFCALFFSLVSIAIVSTTFVYNRNEQNMFNMMSNRISTIQALLESKCMYAGSYQDLATHDFSSFMENVANTTKTDVTLYTPGGKVYRSTTPEIYDRMILGSRIDKDAYYNIKYKNQRFYIHKERLAGHKYYALYSPLFNSDGDMVAIVSAPYVDTSYDFTRDALFHAATIINLFFILLIVTLIVSTTIVNAMFRPLIEMGQKMNSADLHGLEYIIYKREDEISGLVDAYNRMVHDLSDSSRQLAQAERDKAWSEMARQVAHEIKNPLTPIKLEIQRLIRLKQKNDPAWNDKFDKVAAVVLEHIDILTDTANEFSTFAKLYSEEPVLIDLDRTLHDQLVIFDNKDNITMSYLGMEHAMVMAPKPQLIRVFVNLITNAIQAIEIQQKENADDGKEVRHGMIQICLRNSTKDGFYDVVFEDNGPGVSDENLGKLFTPNFTTKSAGTGLGLAICRNIVEKCNGEIVYQKSFVLKGACFTVRLPKYTETDRRLLTSV